MRVPRVASFPRFSRAAKSISDFVVVLPPLARSPNESILSFCDRAFKACRTTNRRRHGLNRDIGRRKIAENASRRDSALTKIMPRTAVVDRNFRTRAVSSDVPSRRINQSSIAIGIVAFKASPPLSFSHECVDRDLRSSVFPRIG